MKAEEAEWVRRGLNYYCADLAGLHVRDLSDTDWSVPLDSRGVSVMGWLEIEIVAEDAPEGRKPRRGGILTGRFVVDNPRAWVDDYGSRHSLRAFFVWASGRDARLIMTDGGYDSFITFDQDL